MTKTPISLETFVHTTEEMLRNLLASVEHSGPIVDATEGQEAVVFSRLESLLEQDSWSDEDALTLSAIFFAIAFITEPEEPKDAP